MQPATLLGKEEDKTLILWVHAHVRWTQRVETCSVVRQVHIDSKFSNTEGMWETMCSSFMFGAMVVSQLVYFTVLVPLIHGDYDKKHS